MFFHSVEFMSFELVRSPHAACASLLHSEFKNERVPRQLSPGGVVIRATFTSNNSVSDPWIRQYFARLQASCEVFLSVSSFGFQWNDRSVSSEIAIPTGVPLRFQWFKLSSRKIDFKSPNSEEVVVWNSEWIVRWIDRRLMKGHTWTTPSLT